MRFLLMVLMLVLAVNLPARAESGYFDKCTQTEDSLMSGDETDWLHMTVPDSQQYVVPANVAPQQTYAVPAANVAPQQTYAVPAPNFVPQQMYAVPAANVVPQQRYVAAPHPAANIVPQQRYMTQAANVTSQQAYLVPAASGGGSNRRGYAQYPPMYFAQPMYAPGVVPGQMMQPMPGYYPIFIIQQQHPPAQAAGAVQPAVQSQTTAQPPAQPQTLTQAITHALNQGQAPQGQNQTGPTDPQASKPGIKGVVDAFLGAGSTVFPNGYAGGGFTLAKPVLNLLLNTF